MLSDMPEERTDPMGDAPKYSGLCRNCEHDATCMLRRSPQLEIIQCEEFSILPVNSRVAYPRMNPLTDPQEAVRLGLCCNCLNVLTCGFPQARRGVLQCEEYQLDEAGVISPAPAECSRSAA
jgi:hypothetical protein